MYYKTVVNMQYVDSKEFDKLMLTTGCVSCSFRGTGIDLFNPGKKIVLPVLDTKLHKSPEKHCFMAGSLSVLQNSH